jgi:tRNA threonylcarbamoyladenosine biosynthesis protein TsaE
MYSAQQSAKYESITLEGLKQVAEEIIQSIDQVKIWMFEGDLGSGKTTLIKEICRSLGVQDAMSSPTFAIVNEYNGQDYQKIFHFDFYRIRKEAEAYDIGVDEYLDSGYPCFIEWPDKIPSLIPTIHAVVTINIENETQRTIAISVHDGKEETRV